MWSLAWNPMGHMLATGGGDHCVRFWCRARPGDAWRDKTRSDQESAGQTGELHPIQIVEPLVDLGWLCKFELGVMVWLLGNPPGYNSSSSEVLHAGWCRDHSVSPANLCSDEWGHSRHRRCGAAAAARFPTRCACPVQQLLFLAMAAKTSWNGAMQRAP